MKFKISFVQNYNLNNKIFDINDKKINRDNYGYFYYKLKEEFNERKFDLSTCDLNKPSDSKIVLYHGLKQKFIDYGYEKSYLISMESPHVDPNSFDKNYHKYFKKVFTWDDNLVDNKKYFKVNYAFDIPKNIPKKFENKKLCCVIAGNKTTNDKNELYSKRVEFVRWFEEKHLDEFDLYGTNWDKRDFGRSFIGKVFNRISFFRKIFFKPFKSYKGLVESKNDTYRNYKFTICYENIKEESGYITEKIFDAFFAGCIPIYWGAKNIQDHIPKECFIDKRNFNSYEEIFEYIKKMNEKTYMAYLDSIEIFLNSSKADEFRAEVFAKTIVDEIIKDLESDNS